MNDSRFDRFMDRVCSIVLTVIALYFVAEVVILLEKVAGI